MVCPIRVKDVDVTSRYICYKVNNILILFRCHLVISTYISDLVGIELPRIDLYKMDPKVKTPKSAIFQITDFG